MSNKRRRDLDDVLDRLNRDSEAVEGEARPRRRKRVRPAGLATLTHNDERLNELSGSLGGGNAREVDCEQIRIWAEHNRIERLLTRDDIAELAARIEAQGQMMPALGRPIDDDGKSVELIYGRRRFEACRRLGRPLKIIVKSMADDEAFAHMYAENDDREDVSDYEQGVSFGRQLASHRFPDQRALAAAYGYSESYVSRAVNLASLPLDLVAAIGQHHELPLVNSAKLATQLKGAPERLPALIEQAQEDREAGRKPSQIIKRLRALLEGRTMAPRKKAPKVPAREIRRGKHVLASVSGEVGQSVQIAIPKSPIQEKLLEQLMEFLEDRVRRL